MPAQLPDAARVHPITLPDGSDHAGTVFLANVNTHPRVEVGAYTYASDFDPPARDGWIPRLAPYLFDFAQERLVIGRFCQIAHGVRFITAAANHDMRGLSTFPFPVFDPETMLGYQPDTRDTVVGHDVWLGYGAQIMPGARIGSGAIIGAGAVVRGTVPEYAVVTGNPGRVVRMRFSDAQIETLLELAWWDWTTEQIAKALPAIAASDIAALKAVSPWS